MENKDHTIPRDSSTESPWQEIPSGKTENNSADLTVIYDTLIVGAGITGITTALMLQRTGQNCLVVDAGNVGFGTTGGTSAHLNTFFDATYPELESDFGEETARLVADSGKKAFATIKELIDEFQIDCDFEYKQAYLFSENEKETKQLLEILESSRKAGIEVTEYPDNEVPVPFEMALHFADQGQFHPLKYIYRMAEEFVKLGGAILEQSFVSQAEFNDGLHEITTSQNIIKSRNLVYATHVPPGITKFSFTCAPYRSYVLGIKLKNEDYPAGLSYDMQEPYHYFRTHQIKGQKYLILGGEDHKTGHDNPETAFSNLEAYARKYYKVEDIVYKWSSQYYVPTDGLPYIGTTGERTYIATGFNGNGMIFGTLSAIIISDQILCKENIYSELYNPSRIKPIAGFSEFVKENADVAYHFIADRLSLKELDTLSDLHPGQGMVTEFNGKEIAVYKDEQGNVTALSPVCTHAGCILTFNNAEKSWDCPCHGGRYDINGQVITGPPEKNLEKLRIS